MQTIFCFSISTPKCSFTKSIADKMERYEEAYQFYTSLKDKGELVASMYALSLLERCDADRASEILEPYRGSEEKAVTDRLRLLDRLKTVKNKRCLSGI